MKNNHKLATFSRMLINSRGVKKQPNKKERILGKQEFFENVFSSYSKHCENYYSFYYLKKFTAKAQNAKDYFPQDFILFYRNNLTLLESDLNKNSVNYINLEKFNFYFPNLKEEEIPQYLFEKICQLLEFT